MSPVTVPGGIPGLLREGAPIAVRFDAPPCEIHGTVLRNGDIACRDGGHSDIYEIGDYQDADFSASQLVVILSEPAGRDIAARWIAERLGLEIGLTAPGLFFAPAVEYAPDCWAFHVSDDALALFSAVGGPVPVDRIVVIPGLPLDPTQGPEAMRAIILHLAGVTRDQA
jgi:hypothetical protein